MEYKTIFKFIAGWLPEQLNKETDFKNYLADNGQDLAY